MEQLFVILWGLLLLVWVGQLGSGGRHQLIGVSECLVRLLNPLSEDLHRMRIKVGVCL
jgi:hypothetical protein